MVVDAALLRAQVRVEGAQRAKQELTGVGRTIGDTGGAARRAQPNIDNFNKGISGTGAQAGAATPRLRSLTTNIGALSPVALGATGAVVAVGTGIKKTTDAALAWESALAGVAKTLDDTGLSAEEFDQAVADIGEQIREMSKEIPIAATELAGVAEAAGQLGVARDDVIQFTETMALLGVSTDLTAEQSAVAIARISNVMGTATEDVGRFGSSLVDLGNNSAATESEILDMTTRIAAAGKQAGLNEADVLGLATALTSVGINAEAGGTAIVQVMNELTKSVELADDRLGSFAQIAGMTAEEFANTWRTTPTEALIAFVEGLADLEAQGGSTAIALDELGLNDIRVSQALRSMAGAGDLARESIIRGNEAWRDNNALQEEAARRFETTASELQIARNRMHDAAVDIGNELTPLMADAFDGLAQSIEDAAGWITDLADVLRTVDEYTRFSKDAAEATGELSAESRALQELARNQPGMPFLDRMPEFIQRMNISEEAIQDMIVEMSDFEGTVRKVAVTQQDLDEIQRAAIEANDGLTQSQIRAREANELYVESLLSTGGATRDLDAETAALIDTKLLEENVLHDVSAAAGLEAAEMAKLERQQFNTRDATDQLTAAHNELRALLDPVQAALQVYNDKLEAGIPLTAEEQRNVVLLMIAQQNLEGQIDAVTVKQGLMAAGMAQQAIPALVGVAQGSGAAIAGLSVLGSRVWPVEIAVNVRTSREGRGGEHRAADIGLTDVPIITPDEILADMGLSDLDTAVAEIIGPSSGGGGGGVGGSGSASSAAAAEAGISLGSTVVEEMLNAVLDGERSLDDALQFVLGNLDELGLEREQFFGSLIAGYQELQEEIKLGELAGDDVSKAQEAFSLLGSAIDQIATDMGISTSEFFTEFSDEAAQAAEDASSVMEREARRVIDAWAPVQDIFTGGISGIEGLFSGDLVASLEQDIAGLETYKDALEELGFGPGDPQYDDVISKIDAANAELTRINQIAGTEAAQAYWDGYAEQIADQEAADRAAANTEAAYEALFSVDPGNFIADTEADIERFNAMIAAGLMDPDVPMSVIENWQQQRDDLVAQRDEFWMEFAKGIALGLIDPEVLQTLDEAGLETLDAYLEPMIGPEGVRKVKEAAGVVGQTIGAETIGRVETMFADAPELGAQFVDDIVQGVIDGTISFEDAMRLLAQIPEDQLIPALARLGDAIDQDLIQAFINGDAAALMTAEGGMQTFMQVLAELGFEMDDLKAKADDAFTSISRFNSSPIAVMTSSDFGFVPNGPNAAPGGGNIAQFADGGNPRKTGFGLLEPSDVVLTGQSPAIQDVSMALAHHLDRMERGGGRSDRTILNIQNMLAPDTPTLETLQYDTMTRRTRRVHGYIP